MKEEPPVYNLSKSKLQSFSQCPKKLWLELYRSDLQETDEMAKLVFQRGTAFGAAVCKCFPGGIPFDKMLPVEALGQTSKWLHSFAAGNERVPMFEAAFVHNNVIIRADILEPASDGKWTLIEVKSSVAKEGEDPRQEYIRDAAIQAYVLEHCDIQLATIELGQPCRDFVLPANGDINGILKRVNISAIARAMTDEVETSIVEALNVVDRDSEPPRDIGAWCSKPHKCGFINHCSGATLRPAEKILIPVWDLAGEPTSRVVSALMGAGHRDLADVPDEQIKKPMHKVMRAIARGADPTLPLHWSRICINSPSRAIFLTMKPTTRRCLCGTAQGRASEWNFSSP